MIIQSNKRYQNDIDRYNSILENIPEGTEKEEFRTLVNSLVREVKKMDGMYLDLIYTNQITTVGNEMREKITLIRKKIEEKYAKYGEKIK